MDTGLEPMGVIAQYVTDNWFMLVLPICMFLIGYLVGRFVRNHLRGDKHG